MAELKAVYKGSTAEVRVIPAATATPAGFTSWGTFRLDTDRAGSGDTETQDPLGTYKNHALYHEVRDLAYKAGHQNMQRLSITVAGVTIAPPT